MELRKLIDYAKELCENDVDEPISVRKEEDMSRPTKCRMICRFPQTLEFVPAKEGDRQEPIILTVDEYEAIRLIDREGLSQEQCSRRMQIARTTAQKIYDSARKKMADALVEGLPLKIEGGEFRLCNGRNGFCDMARCYRKEKEQMELKFYICEHCGNTIMMVKDQGVPVMCCGQNMTELIPGTTDAAVEKHVPVYKVDGNLVCVNVGSVDHPMLAAHYIEWIALATKQGAQIKYLNPGDRPEAVFALAEHDEVEAVYAYCNLHGLWKARTVSE